MDSYFVCIGNFSVSGKMCIRDRYSAVNAGLPCGYREKMCEKARGTTAAFALAQLCYQTLMEEGWKAKVSCENHVAVSYTHLILGVLT